MLSMYWEMFKVHCSLKSEKGQGMVEYALILALVAVVAIALLTEIGTQIQGTFTSVVNSLRGAAGAGGGGT